MSLSPKMRAKVGAMMQLLAEKGNTLRIPYTEHLADGIFELRTIQGNTIVRVLFFFYTGQRIIITNGFIKKTPKTPPKEITLAKVRRAEYLTRKSM